jgi:hypothetical protein
MSVSQGLNAEKTGKRVLEDTMGATMGAAVGAGLFAVASIAFPVLGAILPIGVIGGSVVGLVIRELVQMKRAKEEASKTPGSA